MNKILAVVAVLCLWGCASVHEMQTTQKPTDEKNLTKISIISECAYLTKEGQIIFNNSYLFTPQDKQKIKNIYLSVYGTCALQNLPPVKNIAEELRDAIRGLDAITHANRGYLLITKVA